MTDDQRQAALEAAYQWPSEDPVELWKHKARPPKRERGLDTIPQAWLDAVAARIEAALDQYDESVGRALAEEGQRGRDALAKVKAALELRIDGLAHALDRERALRGGGVVALRKRHDDVA